MENINVYLLVICFILDHVDKFYPSLKSSEDYIFLNDYLEARITNHELTIDNKDIPFEAFPHMTSLRNQLKILCAIFPNKKAIEALAVIDRIIKA